MKIPEAPQRARDVCLAYSPAFHVPQMAHLVDMFGRISAGDSLICWNMDRETEGVADVTLLFWPERELSLWGVPENHPITQGTNSLVSLFHCMASVFDIGPLRPRRDTVIEQGRRVEETWRALSVLGFKDADEGKRARQQLYRIRGCHWVADPLLKVNIAKAATAGPVS